MAAADLVPTSDAEVCALALLNIGESTGIEVVGEETTAGLAAERFYAQALGEVLRDFRWPFAKRILTPAALVETLLGSTVVPDLWGYAFTYPADCVEFHGVYPFTRYPAEDQKIENDIINDPNVGRIIVCDVEEPTFFFTARISDVAQFSPGFIETLSWKLSVKFALSIRKDRAMARDCMTAYQESLTREVGNAKREVHAREPMAPHIRARG